MRNISLGVLIFLLVVIALFGIYQIFTPNIQVPPPLSPTPSTNESVTPTGGASMTAQIYLIALEDGGGAGREVGCGDSLVSTPTQVSASEPIHDAYEALFSVDTQIHTESGYYNSLSQSKLKVGEIEVEDGVARVYLSGELVLGGVCDGPRVQAQLEEAALQFGAIDSVFIFINEVPLEEILSSR